MQVIAKGEGESLPHGSDKKYKRKKKENVSCAPMELSVVDFVMYLLPDCDSFKSALPLSFELEVCFNASLFLHYVAFSNHFPKEGGTK